jgi:hypothetical protein
VKSPREVHPIYTLGFAVAAITALVDMFTGGSLELIRTDIAWVAVAAAQAQISALERRLH